MAGGAKTLRDAMLPMVDRMRGLPTLYGLRPHIVAVRINTWSGERVGIGTKTAVTTGMKVDLAIGNVKVRNLSQREVIASGGLYTDQDLTVGPITPPYSGSAIDNDAISIFDPPMGSLPTEVFFRVQGPGYAAAGDWFEKVGQRVDQSFRYMMTLRKTGKLP